MVRTSLRLSLRISRLALSLVGLVPRVSAAEDIDPDGIPQVIKCCLKVIKCCLKVIKFFPQILTGLLRFITGLLRFNTGLLRFNTGLLRCLSHDTCMQPIAQPLLGLLRVCRRASIWVFQK